MAAEDLRGSSIFPNATYVSVLSSERADRAERKRVAGVLAQRRYRQRKRQHVLMLEATLGNNNRHAETHDRVVNPIDNDTRSHSAAGNPDTLQAYPCAAEITDLTSQETWYGSAIESQDMTLWNSQFSQSPSSDSQFMLLDGTLSSDLASIETSQFQFPDDHVLDIPELECMNTACVFAKLLNCEDTIWCLTASRTLDLPPSATSLLPTGLRPTSAQRQITHHPIFDILPWPSVRTRFICVFSQPPELRPPNARDEMAIVRLIYDIDDSAEGLKVNGEDRVDVKNWEVGQQVFQNWWWAFDHEILANSNILRAKRGANRLQLTPL